MVVRVRSLLVSGPIVVPLNTGLTVRLSAGQVSGDLPDVEVADNAKVEKLRRQGVISVETVDESSDVSDDAASADQGAGEAESRRSRKRADAPPA